MVKVSADLSSVTVVGFDLAKLVFQVCCLDAQGQVVLNRSLKRREVLPFFERLRGCLVGIEACGSAHHWGRALIARGHEVKLIPPAYVKPYVRRQKNDAVDAAAIAEAVTRPTMRFVAVRSIDNQAELMHHRVREMLVTQRTQMLNAVRAHLAEVGVIAAQGAHNARALAHLLASGHPDIPSCVAQALLPLAGRIDELDTQIDALDKHLAIAAKADPQARRLMTIPGIGPQTAHALVATLGPDGIAQFASPRELSAFLGLAPRQNSSGGKTRLGRISKMGNQYVRKLLVVGAHSVLCHRERHNDALRTWAKALIANKPFKLVAVAVANKMARLVYAVLTSQTDYTAKA